MLKQESLSTCPLLAPPLCIDTQASSCKPSCPARIPRQPCATCFLHATRGDGSRCADPQDHKSRASACSSWFPVRVSPLAFFWTAFIFSIWLFPFHCRILFKMSEETWFRVWVIFGWRFKHSCLPKLVDLCLCRGELTPGLHTLLNCEVPHHQL